MLNLKMWKTEWNAYYANKATDYSEVDAIAKRENASDICFVMRDFVRKYITIFLLSQNWCWKAINILSKRVIIMKFSIAPLRIVLDVRIITFVWHAETDIILITKPNNVFPCNLVKEYCNRRFLILLKMLVRNIIIKVESVNCVNSYTI